MEKEDVNEAMRLMEMSKDSLNASQEHTRSVTSLPDCLATSKARLQTGLSSLSFLVS